MTAVLDERQRQAQAFAERFTATSAMSPLIDQFRWQSQAFAKQIADASAMTSVLDEYQRQAQAIAERLAAAAAPAWLPSGSTSRELVETTPSIDWLFFGQVTLRALFAAIAFALVVALWEEQKESAPATAFFEALGALKLWHEIDGAIWKKFS
jgi:hypothetical protein